MLVIRLPAWAGEESRRLFAEFQTLVTASRAEDKSASDAIQKLKKQDAATVEVMSPVTKAQVLLRSVRAEIEAREAGAKVLFAIDEDVETEATRISREMMTLIAQLRKTLAEHGWPKFEKVGGIDPLMFENERVRALASAEGAVKAHDIIVVREIQANNETIAGLKKRAEELTREIHGWIDLDSRSPAPPPTRPDAASLQTPPGLVYR